MTSLEKKAINHCINSLNGMDTLRIYQFVSKVLDEIGAPNKADVMADLSNMTQLFITNPKNEAKEWLTEILKD